MLNLLYSGANINAKDKYIFTINFISLGWTPLHRAAYWGESDPIISILINHGADVNAKD